MEITLYKRLPLVLLTALSFLASNIFADIPAPTPKRIIDESTGYQLGYVVGVGLFILAGVLIVFWIVSKFSKRATK